MPTQGEQSPINFSLNSIFPYFTGAFAGTIASHPVRVCLNRAAYNGGILTTLQDSRHYLTKGFGLNFGRCLGAVSLQAWSKGRVQQLFEENTVARKVAGIGAATLVGTSVATCIETIFIRKTTLPQGVEYKTKLPLTKLSVPLSACYLLREFGFSLAVLSDYDLLSIKGSPALLAAATWSAMAHKFAIWQATSDMMAVANLGATPNIERDGIRKTLAALAQGNVYTHPSCKVPINNPVNIIQQATNLFSVSCGRSMLFFRLFNLVLFKKAYEIGVASAPTIEEQGRKVMNNMFSFFRVSTKEAQGSGESITPKKAK